MPLGNSAAIEAAFKKDEDSEFQFEQESNQCTIDFSDMICTGDGWSDEPQKVRRLADDVVGHSANEEFLNCLTEEQVGQLQSFINDIVSWSHKREIIDEKQREQLVAKVTATCGYAAGTESKPSKLAQSLRSKVEASREEDEHETDKVDPESEPDVAQVRAPRKARPIAGFGIEDVGQTNSSVVGANFMKMMLKASIERRNPRYLADGLMVLGFTSVADELAPLITNSQDAEENRMDLWKMVCTFQTKEESGDVDDEGESKVLYRELNRALSVDDESLWNWADYFACLFHAGSFGAALPPPEMCPSTPQTTYRGFAMDPELAKGYTKGQVFFWQTFVSTCKDLEQSTSFAQKICEEGQVPFVFHLDLPAYGEYKFCAYELSDISEYEDADVLLPPYTQFRVSKDAQSRDDAIHVFLRVISQPFIRELQRITVLVDPAGFESGTNKDFAQIAFATGMPKFRRYESPEVIEDSRFPSGQFYDFGVVPRALDGLALFTDAKGALEWIKAQMRLGSVHFRFLVAGRVSSTFLDGFFKAHRSTPCEALVYCSNMEKWKEYWKDSPKVQVTYEEADVKQYLTHVGYDEFADRIVQVQDLIGKDYQDRQVWYPWRRVDHGVVYGGAGAYTTYHQDPWTQGTGRMPAVAMAPFDVVEAGVEEKG